MAEALRIHERLFLRQDVTDPNRQPVRAVQTIAFQTFMKQGEWTAATPGSAYPGTVHALYEIDMLPAARDHRSDDGHAGCGRGGQVA